jgi:hypothetical protein
MEDLLAGRREVWCSAVDDFLQDEGMIFRHILYLCVVSAFLRLGAGS